MTKKKTVSYGYANLRNEKYNWRSIFMLCFLFILLGALIARAAYLQMYRQDFLQDKGEARYARNLIIPASRGKIYDRNGQILAMSSPVKSVWAIPEDAANLTDEHLKELSVLLGLKPEDIKKKMFGKKNFAYLKRQVEPEVSKILEERKFPGIHQENTFKRYYPSGEVMAHVTGFVDLEEDGQEGIELAFNKDLTGIDGERKVLKNRRGQVIDEMGPRIEPQNGNDVYLTIDSKIQYVASVALGDAVKKHNAKAGSAVVLDAKTGEILALVNMPNYNPNTREGLTGEKLRNRVITDIYEPGSTMKPFPIAMALDKKLVTPNTMFDTRGIIVGGKSISDAHGHSSLNVSEIIQKSSNIGTVKIAMQLKPEEMFGLFNSIGFGKQVGIGFPGEAKGIVRPVKTWKPIEQATMSFGHGISVNLLQMAHAYLAFSNNGEIRPISLIKKEEKEIPATRIFSEATAKKMQVMLESVTSKEGTAFQSQTPSYRVAGKTGTANKLENGRYAHKYVGSFIGFAPVSNPRVVVAVMIDEPRSNGYYGGVVAAPVFSRITEEALKTLGVPPDKEEAIKALEEQKALELQKQELEKSKAGSAIIVDNDVNLNESIVEPLPEENVQPVVEKKVPSKEPKDVRVEPLVVEKRIPPKETKDLKVETKKVEEKQKKVEQKKIDLPKVEPKKPENKIEKSKDEKKVESKKETIQDDPLSDFLKSKKF